MEPDELLHRLAELGRDPPEPDSSCPDRTTLEAFRAGKLAPSEQQQVEAHLALCAGCLDRLVAREPITHRMSRETRARVFRATRVEGRRHRSFVARLLFGAVPVAAASALALVLIPRHNAVPLPDYAFSLSGAIVETRGTGLPDRPDHAAAGTGNAPKAPRSDADSRVPIFVPGSVLTLHAAPELAPPEHPPVCVVTLEDPSGRSWRVSPAPVPTVDPESGSLEVRLGLEPLLGQRFGRYRVNLWLFPDGAAIPETLARNLETAPVAARRFEAEFLYQPSP